MPFTFSHPAAAVPLLRPLGRYGSLSALAIGSIAPDLAFIVPIGFSRDQTHGLAALFWFCLPAGALVYLLFHALLKAPLLALAPNRFANRFPEKRAAEPWSAVLVSLLCGAVTHVIWDAFTHPGTPVVDALPWLQSELASIGGYRLYGFGLLQHASSIIGLALLALWTWNWLRKTPAASERGQSLSNAERIGVLTGLVSVPFFVGLFAGWRRTPLIADMTDLQEFMMGFIFTALPTAAFVVIIYAVLWRLCNQFQ